MGVGGWVLRGWMKSSRVRSGVGPGRGRFAICDTGMGGGNYGTEMAVRSYLGQ